VAVSRPDDLQGYGTTTLNAAHTKGQLYLNLVGFAGIALYSPIIVELDAPGAVVWWTTFCKTAPIVSTYIEIETGGEGLPYAAASGNTVYVPNQGDEFLSIGDVTTTDFNTR
jgi:hypothetical protein